MHSFVQFKKQKLQKKLSNLSVQEALEQHLDILRLEATQAIKLPALLTESNLVTKSAYDFARKQDYEDHKELVNLIISELKNNMFLGLVTEAEAATATAPVVSLDSLRAELKSQVKQLVNDLKIAMQTGLNASRQNVPPPVPPAANAGGTQSGSSGAAQSQSSNDDLPMTPEQREALAKMHSKRALPLPQNFAQFTRGQANALYRQMKTPSDDPVQTGRGQSGSTNRWSPEGGLGGIARGMWRVASNPFKRWWQQRKRDYWNDQTLENHDLSQIFFENAVDVMTVFDDFEKNMLQLIDDKIDQIVSFVKGGTTGGPSSGGGPSGGPSSPTQSGPNTGAVQPRQGAARPAQDIEPQGDEDGSDVGDQGQGQDQGSGEQGGLSDGEGDQPTEEEFRKQKFAKLGAEYLGMAINEAALSKKGDRVYAGKLLASHFLVDGKPLTTDERGTGWGFVKAIIFDKIFKVMMKNWEATNLGEEELEKYHNIKSNKGKTTDRHRLVRQWLNIGEEKARARSGKFLLDVLAAFYSKNNRIKSGVPSTIASRPASGGQEGDRPAAPRVAKGKTIAPEPPKEEYSNEPTEWLKQLQERHPEVYAKLQSDSGAKNKNTLDLISEPLNGPLANRPDRGTVLFKHIWNMFHVGNKPKPAAETKPAAAEPAAETKPAAAEPAAETKPAAAETDGVQGFIDQLESSDDYQKIAQKQRELHVLQGKNEKEIEKFINDYKNYLVTKLQAGENLKDLIEGYSERIELMKANLSQTAKSNQPQTNKELGSKPDSGNQDAASEDDSASEDERALEKLYSNESINSKMAKLTPSLVKKGFSTDDASEITEQIELMLIDDIKNGVKLKEIFEKLVDFLNKDAGELSAIFNKKTKVETEGVSGNKISSSESFQNTLEKFRRMINS